MRVWAIKKVYDKCGLGASCVRREPGGPPREPASHGLAQTAVSKGRGKIVKFAWQGLNRHNNMQKKMSRPWHCNWPFTFSTHHVCFFFPDNIGIGIVVLIVQSYRKGDYGDDVTIPKKKYLHCA